MITRKEVLADAEYLEGKEFYIPVAKAIRRLREYVQQDPDPDAAVWAEVNELLGKLSENESDDKFELACSTGTPHRWQVITRHIFTQKWAGVFQREWLDLPEIRDQLKTLVTKRGLLVPSLEDMAAIFADLPTDNMGYTLTVEQVAQVKAFIAALAAKEGEG